MPSTTFASLTLSNVPRFTGRKVSHALAPSSAMTLVSLKEAQANSEIKYRGLWEEERQGEQAPKVVDGCDVVPHVLAPSSAMTLVPLKKAQADPEIKYRGLYEEAKGPKVVDLGMGVRAYNPVHGVTVSLVPLKEAQRNAAIKYWGL